MDKEEMILPEDENNHKLLKRKGRIYREEEYKEAEDETLRD